MGAGLGTTPILFAPRTRVALRGRASVASLSVFPSEEVVAQRLGGPAAGSDSHDASSAVRRMHATQPAARVACQIDNDLTPDMRSASPAATSARCWGTLG
jgi:hypothetical protein